MSGRCIANECLGTTGFSYTLSLINGKYKMTILYTLMACFINCLFKS